MSTPSSAPASSRSREPWRVLLFPGGTEIALELREALAACKEVRLFSAGIGGSNHAPFAFRHHTVVPLVGQPGWLEALQRLIREERLTHIFPAHDDALVALAENAAALAPARIVTSPVATCRLTRSKVDTHAALAAAVPTPRRFTRVEDVTSFPIFLKPDRGQGAQRTARADDAAQARELLREDPDRTLWEFLPGEEYTVDCFSDRDGGLLYASGRRRCRVRSGIAMHSQLVDDPIFADYARRIAQVLPLWGAWFYQVKRDAAGTLRLLEVAPRVGGTSALSRARGVNLPLLSLFEAERRPLAVRPGPQVVEIDRALRNRFRHNLEFRTVYLDYDDTVVVHDRVNVDVIRFAYQCIDRGIRVVLLTRHAGDLAAELERRRLDRLFDAVVHLRAGESKATQVVDRPALFIDDSFAEREAVRAATDAAVADPTMIDLFLDDRS